MNHDCEIGAILDGAGVSNVVGGPLDGLYIQGPDRESPQTRTGYKIWVNYLHEYVWCYARDVWEYEGKPNEETGFTVLPFVSPIQE